MTPYTTAPPAPGALGEDIAPEAILAYLQALGTWRDRRRAELDSLDEASLRSPERDALTGDVLLSMTLWKAVADRHDLVLAAWDSGRVLPADRRRIATLIWGRLDQQASEGSALSVSLPEACRLSDSLAASLRSRLRLDGAEPDVAGRVRDLRAQVERIRDLVAEVPPTRRTSAQEALVRLDRRVVDVADRARRGADVGGLLGPLEADAAVAERDLIVAAATRTRARDERARLAATIAELAARGEAVRALAARAVAAVTPAPRLGVPDVAALGDPPQSPDDLAAFAARLSNVGRALELAHRAYAAALEERDDLAAQVAADARAADALTDPGLLADAQELRERAEQVLSAAPADVVRLAALAAALHAYVAAATSARSAAARPDGVVPR